MLTDSDSEKTAVNHNNSNSTSSAKEQQSDHGPSHVSFDTILHNNGAFLKLFDPYVTSEWSHHYFQYDTFKHEYKLMKQDHEYDIDAYEQQFIHEIKRVYTFICKLIRQLDTDLLSIQRMLVEMNHANQGQKVLLAHDHIQRDRNIEASIRRVYARCKQLEQFYHVNYYSIFKIGKKMEKLIEIDRFNQYCDEFYDEHHPQHPPPPPISPISPKEYDEHSHKSLQIEVEEGDEDNNNNNDDDDMAVDASKRSPPTKPARKSVIRNLKRMSGVFWQTSKRTIIHSAKKPAMHFSHLDCHVTCWQDSDSGLFFFRDFTLCLPVLTELKQRVVDLYASKFRLKFKELASYELDYVKITDRRNNRTKFFIGFKLGLVVCMVIWLMSDSTTASNSDLDFWSQPAVFVYTTIGNLLVYRFCWAGNIHVWQSYDINYTSILQMSSKRPSLILVVNQSATLLVLYFINLIVFFRANDPNTNINDTFLSYAAPMMLLASGVVYQFWENFVLLRQNKVSKGLFGMKIFKRLVMAPWVPLQFRDVYCADVLTSFTRIIVDSLYASCWVTSGAFLDSDKDHTITSFGAHGMQCAGAAMVRTVSIVQVLPLVTRTLQCLRGVHDSQYSFYPQGYNTIKYLLSILVVFIALYFPKNLVFYSFVVVVTTVYKWWWDVAMDWGCFDVLPATWSELFTWESYSKKHLFLRRKLMYPSIGLYYVCIFLDLALRFLWVMSLLPSGALGGLVGSQLGFFLGSMEIIRRSMWGVFRVEYEHLKLLNKKTPGFLRNQVMNFRPSVGRMSSQRDFLNSSEQAPLDPASSSTNEAAFLKSLLFDRFAGLPDDNKLFGAEDNNPVSKPDGVMKKTEELREISDQIMSTTENPLVLGAEELSSSILHGDEVQTAHGGDGW